MFEPLLGRDCSAQTINDNVCINQVHGAGLLQLSDRSFRANSKLSTMSTRSRHIPMNSEFSRASKVAEFEVGRGETVITIAADPVGTSAGNVMRSSRLGGMFVLKVTVFAMRTSLQILPYQNPGAFTTTDQQTPDCGVSFRPVSRVAYPVSRLVPCGSSPNRQQKAPDRNYRQGLPTDSFLETTYPKFRPSCSLSPVDFGCYIDRTGV